MTHRLKILISAYACSPFRGSEPGVGWGFINALASFHDLWVIVEEEKFRRDIEQYLGEHPEFPGSVRFFFLRKKRNRRLRRIWPPSYYRYYRAWQRDAFQLARELHRKVGFDLVHQLTMVGYREPGFLWRLGVPFVWGPVGGMGYFPWTFLHKIGLYGSLYYLCYNIMNAFHMYFLIRPKKAARIAAKGFITATPENRRFALRLWKCDSTVIPEVSVPCNNFTVNPASKSQDPLRIVWSGLHIHRKALNIGLEALSLLPNDLSWKLDVLGKGPKTKPWQYLAKRLGISGRCTFQGWLPREKALKILRQGHIFLITSLRDLNSTVTIEALASGLPVVCLDHCGFSYVVDSTCGIKVPVTTPARTVNSLAQAIKRLIVDDSLRSRLAQGALLRAREFSWEKKLEILQRIYEARIDLGSPKGY